METTTKRRKRTDTIKSNVPLYDAAAAHSAKSNVPHIDEVKKILHFLMTNISDEQLCDNFKDIKRIYTRCQNAVWNVYGIRTLSVAFYTEYLYYDDLCALYCVNKEFTREGKTRAYTRKLSKSTFVNTSQTTANDALRKAIKMWLDYTENKGYTSQDTAKVGYVAYFRMEHTKRDKYVWFV